MDFDFLTGLAEIGSSGGRWKSFTAILFGVLGAGLGGYIGFHSIGVAGAAGGVFAGGLIGWFLAALLTGLLMIVVLTVVFGLLYGGWIWLTGGAA